jgi:formylglycine-generating enzyme required for sulfatase activity
MAEIPKGTYPVGCQPDDHGCFDDEPAKLVELGSFAIDRTETTVLAYKECVDAGRCPVPGKGAGCNWGAVGSEDHPVNCIDWTSAAAYCGSVGKRLALGVEWEVAARGLAHPDYPWGDTAPSCDIAAIASDSKDDCSLRGTLPVGRKPRDRSWAGVMDLGGNVREWVSDPYGTDATGSSQERVNRGGSWQMSAGKLFTAHTIGADRFSVKRPDLGVRCAVSKGEDGSD